ncbi:MAG: preprotein translocase subunit YajC [Brooklawnia sp.]|jgi:preprotein translocase subunit YajC
MEVFLMLAVFIGLMYVLMVLPQRKKMEQQRKMIAALQPGSRVMLNTGLFGTIRATGDAQLVVELAPGVEVTVLKQAVARMALPDEEEFEYTDAGGQASTTDEFVADSLDNQWQVSPGAAEFGDLMAPDSEVPATAHQDLAEDNNPVDFLPPALPDSDNPDAESERKSL